MNDPSESAAGAPHDLAELRRQFVEAGLESIETHISLVILGLREVWKVKKPVDLGFLDFTTLERRHAACEAEVSLNRRLAPDTYLGVVPVRRAADGWYRFGGEGEVVDWAVHMKRLPDADRADVRLAAGTLQPAALRALAGRLAEFHESARCDPETSGFGKVEVVRKNAVENFAQVGAAIDRCLDPEQARELETWQLGFLDRHRERFEDRVEQGRVRDGHGDLRLDHVYFGPDGEIAIVDCIEFNERFRYADVCADIAFLAMDLAWHGDPALGERFLADYAELADDYDLYSMVDFYESYRAFVRGKIASFSASDQALESAVRERAEAEARRYFLLALAAEKAPLASPRLIVVGGMIGSGKSTAAKRLARNLSAPVVSADLTRKRLLGVEPAQPVRPEAFEGEYSAAMTERVYREVLRRARVVIESGRSVIVDASFRSAAHRAEARALATELGVPFHFVECRAERTEIEARLRRRERQAGVSDGRLEILDAFAASWEEVSELDPAEHEVIDTSGPKSKTARKLDKIAGVDRGSSG